MKVILLAAALVAGCATTQPQADTSALEAKVKELNDRVEWVYFDIRVQNCFDYLASCKLMQAHGGAKGKNCFKEHELCVVTAHKEYTFMKQQNAK